MATDSWKNGTSGDWNTATSWSTGAVPAATDDVTIDATNITQAYTVTVTKGESVGASSLTLNAPDDGTNQTPYVGAILQMDGTMTFAPGSAGLIGGSLQSVVLSNGGTFINAGTVAPFIQCSGEVLFTGTNGFYVENELQSIGTVVVDTKNINELIGNTLTDGIFSAVGSASVIDLGGALEGLKVDITKIQGPAIDPNLGFTGWTELTLNGPGTQINEWNGAAYVSLESTLTDIGARGTLDVLNGRDYVSANALTIEAQGMLDLQAGTVNTGVITISGSTTVGGTLLPAGILQGSGTIANDVVNNGTISVLSGTLADGKTTTSVLDIVGPLTGTGTVVFDVDSKFTTSINPTGATLEVGSVAVGQTVVMNGDDTLILTQPAGFAGTLDAKLGDKIVLQGVTATSAVDNNGTLVLSNAGGVVASLKVAGTMASDAFTANGSIVTVGTASATSGFSIADATSNTTTNIAGSTYTGPVAGLTSELILPTTHQVTVTANAPNVFIQVGMQGQTNPTIAGINVSAANGNNVLDSYAGSSFLTDGSGIDQNYIDAREATQNSWSTVVNFHSGDNVTIWGVTPQDFNLNWIGDTYGATGATGLTAVYTSNIGGHDIGITLAGFTNADATNGRLAVTYSSIQGNTYASIHAT